MTAYLVNPGDSRKPASHANLFRQFDRGMRTSDSVPVWLQDARKGDRVYYLPLPGESNGIYASGFVEHDSAPSIPSYSSTSLIIDRVLKPEEVKLTHDFLRTYISENVDWETQEPTLALPEDAAIRLKIAWDACVSAAIDIDPPWNREEFVLLLGLFDEQGPDRIEWRSRSWRIFCLILNRLPYRTRNQQLRRYRDPVSVYQKLMQYARWDPSYRQANDIDSNEDTDLHIRFMVNSICEYYRISGEEISAGDDGLDLQMDTYLEFCDDRQRRISMQHAIQRAYKWAPESFHADHFEDDFVEGRVLTYIHRKMETDPRARMAKLRQLDQSATKPTCGLCQSELSKSFVSERIRHLEFHHTLRLDQLDPTKTAEPDDMMPVCPNCHRAIHEKHRGHALDSKHTKYDSRTRRTERKRRNKKRFI